jgi:DNA-binding response OmpR family regulator
MARKLNFPVVPLTEVSMNDTIVHAGYRLPLVLVVDDERVIADTLTTILSRSGFNAITAYDGETALALANATPPDLLISDVVMPGMTGVDLAIALTHVLPACKVLLFSGQAATVDLLEKARESGHDFTTLAKPVHPTDMLMRVRQSLAIPGAILKDDPSTAFGRPSSVSYANN